jgi:hypothetical protein
MTKVVVRVLDRDNRRLGWEEHYALLRGDGCLRASDDLLIHIAEGGIPAAVSVHWCDPNVEVRTPVAREKWSRPFLAFRYNDPIIRVGEMPGPLPAVTVGSVMVGIPVGSLGARG